MIQRVRKQGLDKGAPTRHGNGVILGHSVDADPIRLDVRIDPYAVTPDLLQAKAGSITEWLVSSLQRLRAEIARAENMGVQA
jgi:hypothetical protein